MMKKSVFHAPTDTTVIFLVCMFYCTFPPSQPLRMETLALLEFKSHLRDPLNLLDSWQETESPCRFRGVSCDPVSGLVTGISLDNASLSGEISPSISALRRLETLSLPSNAISGPLPAALVGCGGLRTLNLSMNQMNGTLPDLSDLKILQVLDLSVNLFSGEFPAWLGNLTDLVFVDVSHNSYDSAEIPKSVGNLKNLTWLNFGSTNLRGQIPEEIFGLKGLETLDLSNNSISGAFPVSISNLPKLKKIELFTNNLTGVIPPDLAKLRLLQEIDVSRNRMYGELPRELGDLKELVVFQLYYNSFSGEIPAGFGDLRRLVGFSIYGNSFSGEFPANFGRFSPLVSIDISDNQFSGSLPKFLCENRRLTNLLALDNRFTGELPSTYADCKSLVRFRISKNRLWGDIPAGAWALPDAHIIDFADNAFTGGISPDVGVAASLAELILVNNRFSGNLPMELGKLSALEKLYLANNSFSGGIPPAFGQLTQLSYLHLEQNALTGSIPAEMGRCHRLVEFNVAWNSLSGHLPSTITQMSSLNSLNVSGNRLTGMIPGNLNKMTLSSIDFSRNQLSGLVPHDLFNIGGYQAFLGNQGLCIEQNSRISANVSMKICDGNHQNKQGSGDKLVTLLLCIILSVLVVVFVGLLLVSYRSFNVRGAFTDHYMEEGNEGGVKWKLQSSQLEFEEDEICNLEEVNLIGSGATGKVYRLDSKRNGATVAVKQLWKGSGVKVLGAEMEILGKIRHKNILKLYACLVKGESSFLVFEYMTNGNLHQALHRQTKGGRLELDWCQRYRIALGAAMGIAYLHHDYSPSIIHRDIKSTNILLDEDYEPKIADFGLAKIAHEASHAMASSCFAGTHGYIAPELAYSVKLTKKSDVYSFGVVLLELVSGRNPIEDEYGEGKDIVHWVSTHLHDRKGVSAVLDHRLAFDFMQDYMIKVLQIAVLCTSSLPSLRPTMREVVKMLVDASPSAPRAPNKSPKVTL